jgi:hypothetical protein
MVKLGDFLSNRGQPGDAEKAVGHYQRSLDICERLLASNPDSAQAARDVMVMLERLAEWMAKQAGGGGKALDLQKRALEIALRLRESDQQSVFHGRTAAVAFYLTGQRASAAGQEDLGARCFGGCHAVLHELISAGCQLDPQMTNLYQQLHPRFSK